jgi:GNAT superfamily N-acetyltransferase
VPRLSLRPATVDDAAAIAALHIASWQTAYRGAVSDAYLDTLDVAQHTGNWRQRLLDGSDHVLLAVEDDVVVAFCAVGPSADTDADRTTWLIANLHVTPDRKRQGVGTQIFEAAVALAHQHGARQVTLWVIEVNQAARRFYEKRGMLPDGARRRDNTPGRDVALVRYALVPGRPSQMVTTEGPIHLL